ncbi:MAG: N-acetylmuramoyl-L-alanine amidase [Intestinibacter sp.]
MAKRKITNKKTTQGRNRKKKKGLHRKKTSVNKKKLIVVLICTIIALFIVGFVGNRTVNFVSDIWPNVISLKNSLTGGKVDKSNVNTDEQFDVGDENKDTLQKKHNVFIDVGCGGYEIGYVASNKTKEKDLNLKIAKKVAKKLAKEDDINVTLSRQEDVYLSPDERKALAENEKAEVFVSIHMAGEKTGDASGVQTIYQKDSENGSYDLAIIMQTSVSAYVKARDRGTSAYDMSILRDNSMPAVYIQCGFLSNSSELKNLTNSKYQDDLAEGIAQGILTYIDAKK